MTDDDNSMSFQLTQARDVLGVRADGDKTTVTALSVTQTRHIVADFDCFHRLPLLQAVIREAKNRC